MRTVLDDAALVKLLADILRVDKPRFETIVARAQEAAAAAAAGAPPSAPKNKKTTAPAYGAAAASMGQPPSKAMEGRPASTVTAPAATASSCDARRCPSSPPTG